MAKILVVDDEPDLEVLVKQKFRKQIREGNYEFVFAANGRHALEQLEQNSDVEIVLSDINMPEMDGLTLLNKLAEKHSLLKAVIVSAYGDMDNIRTAMNRGAFDFVTKPLNFEDLEITIEKTIKQVHQIQETLNAIRENNILKMYVDETVLNFMGNPEYEAALLKNETVDATVAFIDICGFTQISENEKPDVVVDLLNQYFDLMVKEVIDQKGIVDKFIGDAIMAVFRGDHHADRAIDACLAARDAIEKLPAISDYSPEVSIGINSGEFVSGNIGSSSLKRLDYTVIGNVVNVAQRIQGEANPGQLLITEDTYNLVKESFKCQAVESLEVKNLSEPVKVYEVLE